MYFICRRIVRVVASRMHQERRDYQRASRTQGPSGCDGCTRRRGDDGGSAGGCAPLVRPVARITHSSVAAVVRIRWTRFVVEGGASTEQRRSSATSRIARSCVPPRATSRRLLILDVQRHRPEAQNLLTRGRRPIALQLRELLPPDELHRLALDVAPEGVALHPRRAEAVHLDDDLHAWIE